MEKLTDTAAWMTKGELKDYLAANWRHNIWYRVDNNPTGVYNLIQDNFGDFRSLAKGSETTLGSREAMQKFLEEKAEQYPGGAEAFAAWVFVAVPHNTDVDNWTNQIK